jgi:hypothetical protein
MIRSGSLCREALGDPNPLIQALKAEQNSLSNLTPHPLLVGLRRTAVLARVLALKLGRAGWTPAPRRLTGNRVPDELRNFSSSVRERLTGTATFSSTCFTVRSGWIVADCGPKSMPARLTSVLPQR